MPFLVCGLSVLPDSRRCRGYLGSMMTLSQSVCFAFIDLLTLFISLAQAICARLRGFSGLIAKYLLRSCVEIRQIDVVLNSEAAAAPEACS